jgi:hypothetical protein
MDILDGKIMFRLGEAADVIAPGEGTRHEEMTIIDQDVTEVDPDQAVLIARTLHAIIIDPHLAERQRSNAAHQLLAISLAGLRSSVEVGERWERAKQAMDTTAAADMLA